MNEIKIYQELNKIFKKVFNDANLIIKPKMSAKDVETWDSLSNIRMIVAVEAKFKIRFSIVEISNLKNVGQFVKVIQKYVSKKKT